MKRHLISDIIFRAAIAAVGVFFLICLIACLVSCKPKQQIVERTLTDTVFVSRADTLRLISERVDSVVYRDSVFTLIKGDTIFVKEYHFRDLTKKVGNDSYKARTDTVWQTRTVTEYKTRTVEVEKKLAWWQKALMWLGAISLTAGTAIGIAFLRKRL